MLRLALVFLIIALASGSLGYFPVENPSIETAKILFFIFIVLAILSLLGGAVRPSHLTR